MEYYIEICLINIRNWTCMFILVFSITQALIIKYNTCLYFSAASWGVSGQHTEVEPDGGGDGRCWWHHRQGWHFPVTVWRRVCDVLLPRTTEEAEPDLSYKQHQISLRGHLRFLWLHVCWSQWAWVCWVSIVQMKWHGVTSILAVCLDADNEFHLDILDVHLLN